MAELASSGLPLSVTASQVSQYGAGAFLALLLQTPGLSTRGAQAAAWVAPSLEFSYQYLPLAPYQLWCPRLPTRPGDQTRTQVGDGMIWVC